MISRTGTVALVSLGVLGVTGAAFAYFSATGLGAGAAQTRTAPGSVTLAPGTATGALHPGGSGTVTTTATNTSDTEVRLSSLQLDTTQGSSGFAVDAAHSGCTSPSLSFTSQNNGGSGWTINAGGTLPITLAGAVSLTSTAPNACQGATVTVYLKVGT